MNPAVPTACGIAAAAPAPARAFPAVRVGALIVVAGLLGGLAWLGGAVEWVDPRRLVPFLEGFGALAPAVFVAVMAGAVVVSPIPSLPLDAAAGAVFGPAWGTVYSVAGAEAGALISFGIARALGREAVARLLKSEVGFCDRCAEHHLARVVFFSRLLPIFSFDLVSYGAGLTRISWRGFAVATLLGMLPATFVFNYFGSGVFAHSGALFVSGGLLVVAFLVVPRWIARRNPWGLFDRLEPHR